MRAALRDPHGVRVPIGAGGALIGRGPEASIVLDEAQVSRRHALVLIDDGGPLVLPLARSGVVVDGVPRYEATPLVHGGVLSIGSCAFVVEVEVERDPRWMVAIGHRRYPITMAVFTIGGDASDDLQVVGWPRRAAVLYRIDAGHVLETADGAFEIASAGAALERSAPHGSYVLAPDSRFRRADIEVSLVAADAAPAATEQRASLPRAAVLEFVPNGALLRLQLAAVHTVFLPQLRGSLIAALLDPRSPRGGAAASLRGGDWIPDPYLMTRVWGRDAASAAQLNVLVYRARQSLNGAGLAGPELIQRAPGGGATRFQLAPGAHIEIH